MKIVGDLRVANRTFVDSPTLRGTWPGGPAVEDIRRRAILDSTTKEVIRDEVFLSYDPMYSWLGALPEGSRPAGDPRTIEVTLWYEDGPIRVDPSLPPMDSEKSAKNVK